MPLDAFCLNAVVTELNAALADMKIEKIVQPERDEINIVMRGRGENARLLICASPTYARIHVTAGQKENPPAPPMFCMLLRKHLTGARLREIAQLPLERAVILTFSCTDEFGEPCEKKLICELMGRHSNIILLAPDGRIVDCLRHVDQEMSERRMVLPGLIWRVPPPQDKASPLDPPQSLMRSGAESEDFFLENFSGISPLVARELSFWSHSCGADNALLRLREIYARKSYAPHFICGEDGAEKDFTFIKLEQYGENAAIKTAQDFSSLLDGFYTRRDNAQRMKNRSAQLVKTVRSAYERTERKLAQQREEYERTLDRERLREKGDILGAFISEIPRGSGTATLQDFYGQEGATVEIKLDPRLSPAQNAQKYYKEYSRMKNAEKMLTGLIEQGEKELLYLDSVQDELGRAVSQSDITDIRDEIAAAGYITSKSSDRKKQKPTLPLRYLSSDGFVIWAGKNNRQNDELTLRSASKQDIWLHTQKIPGSHVIIECDGKTVPDRTLTEAAVIAATHSRANGSKSVPVDYCAVRFVKKPPGAKPGMVIYSNFKTAYCDPDTEFISKLSKG